MKPPMKPPWPSARAWPSSSSRPCVTRLVPRRQMLPVSSRHNYCPLLRRMLNAATWLIAFLAAAAHTSAVAAFTRPLSSRFAHLGLRGGTAPFRRMTMRAGEGSCTVLVVAESGSRPPMVAHSFDTAGGVDFRLVKVPARTPERGTQRPVFLYEENALPRFEGALRGPIPEYAASGSGSGSQPIGFIPEVEETYAYWEAASGICNEKGVMVAECTCSSIFSAQPKPTGKALLGYMELTRLAMERSASARQAVDLMGALAEQFGFYGNSMRLTGSAESLAVADGTEAWVFHVLPDDSGASAIWAAQRVPSGQAAAVTNMFVIRNVELDQPDCFRYSASMIEVAQRLGLWRGGSAPFDFTKVYSSGEARHKFYSGRRLWRALSLFNRAVSLPTEYDDLVLHPAYPFAVEPDRELTARDLREMMRDYYQDTPFDMQRALAAGPFGNIDRYTCVVWHSHTYMRTPTPPTHIIRTHASVRASLHAQVRRGKSSRRLRAPHRRLPHGLFLRG